MINTPSNSFVASQVVTVSPTSGQYRSPIDAVNSITDAAANKQYVVLLYPGVYNLGSNSLVLKDYVHLNGVSVPGAESAVQITCAGDTDMIQFGTVGSSIENIHFPWNPINSSRLFEAIGTTGRFTIKNCIIDCSLPSDFNVRCGEFDCEEIVIDTCRFNITKGAASPLAANIRFLRWVSGNAFINNCIFTYTNPDNDARIEMIDWRSPGDFSITNTKAFMNITAAAFVEDAEFINTSNAPGLGARRILEGNTIIITGNGTGTGTAYELDTSDNSGISNIYDGVINVSGFTNNQAVHIETGDTINLTAEVISGDISVVGGANFNGAYPSQGRFNITEGLVMAQKATVPTSPVPGQAYIDNGSNTASGQPGWRQWNGSAWEDLGALAGAFV
jgi:hypothetical protein